jgi:hypothetical protein
VRNNIGDKVERGDGCNDDWMYLSLNDDSGIVKKSVSVSVFISGGRRVGGPPCVEGSPIVRYEKEK